MFCPNCGNQIADGSAFCPNCGNTVNAAPQQPQQPVYQQPVQPQYQQPVYQQPAQPQYQQPVYQQPAAPAADFATMARKNLAIIMVVIAIFGALMFVLNTFQILELPVEGNNGKTIDRSVSDIADAWDDLDESFALGYIANIVMGLCSLVAAAIGALYFLKEKNNMPYYDQFIAKYLKGKSPLLVAGLIGAIGCVLQFILMMLTGIEFMGVEISVGVHALTWVALVIYAAAAAVDFFVINKKAA